MNYRVSLIPCMRVYLKLLAILVHRLRYDERYKPHRSHPAGRVTEWLLRELSEVFSCCSRFADISSRDLMIDSDTREGLLHPIDNHLGIKVLRMHRGLALPPFRVNLGLQFGRGHRWLDYNQEPVGTLFGRRRK